MRVLRSQVLEMHPNDRTNTSSSIQQVTILTQLRELQMSLSYCNGERDLELLSVLTDMQVCSALLRSACCFGGSRVRVAHMQ